MGIAKKSKFKKGAVTRSRRNTRYFNVLLESLSSGRIHQRPRVRKSYRKQCSGLRINNRVSGGESTTVFLFFFFFFFYDRAFLDNFFFFLLCFSKASKWKKKNSNECGREDAVTTDRYYETIMRSYGNLTRVFAPNVLGKMEVFRFGSVGGNKN